MNHIVQVIKNNLDLSKNIPLKLSLYEAFKKTIILREIPAGSRINEKEFALELNISRTPIRYALSELLKEQLVEHVPKKGIIIRGINKKDAVEIFEIRKALDTLAAVEAMNLMSEKDYTEMEQLLRLSETYSQQGDIQNVQKTFSQFNELIYNKSKMLRLKEIVTELQTYLIYFREISLASEERRDKAIEEHWLIYRGMKNKDKNQITLITHEHLDRSLQFILQEMEKKDGAN